ncbi:MAG: RNA 3'-phosphate cyclase [Thalassolituus sp.]|nr:MAG: RNA 3'-phosphate cyclase [Thalassolituus sp.]
MIVIDGSQGEGGGQIFRTALTLAMCNGETVRIENIRAGRAKPGLLRQHLTCLRAAQAICNAQVSGDKLGSQKVTFTPGSVQPGEYRFAVGSAGSTTLVFQTVFLPLALSRGESELYLEGGTHNDMAPSVDFINHSFLPVLAELGWATELELERYGFYPSGGGAWRVRIHPAGTIRALALAQRGEISEQRAVAVSANIPAHVTARELEQVHKRCYWPKADLQQKLVRSIGPGNIVSLRLKMPELTAVFEASGAKAITAERVAGKAIKAMRNYLSSDAVVCEHLADQLILPLVLGQGGHFTTLELSQHLRTNIDVVKQLTGANIGLKQLAKHCWQVNVEPLDKQDFKPLA